MRPEIAYIDDEKSNLDTLSLFLEEHFYVRTYTDSKNFFHDLPLHNFSAILLDIHMPQMSGFEVFEKILTIPQYNFCPVFFFSSDDTEEMKYKSLCSGAVDFFRRTINPDILLIKLKSRVDFFKKQKNVIDFGRLKINILQLKAFYDGTELPLTFIEFKILSYVTSKFPETAGKHELVEHAWGHVHVMDATIYTHISNLNYKLADWEYEISSIKSAGIRLIKKEYL